LPSGVYVDAGPADILRGPTPADIVLAGGEIRTKREFLRAWADAFGFPDWFGMNWDALADIGGDLSGLPPGDLLILYDRFDVFARAEPREWSIALRILPRLGAEWRSRPQRVIVMLRGPAALAPNLPLAFL
jgi:hypothetical protein